MEAFTQMGNHLVSDSAATINAGDDMSTIEGDETVLNMTGGPRRRKHDDEDEGSDAFEDDDDDDLESMASVAVDGSGKTPAAKVEEEKELPAHACG